MCQSREFTYVVRTNRMPGIRFVCGMGTYGWPTERVRHMCCAHVANVLTNHTFHVRPAVYGAYTVPVSRAALDNLNMKYQKFKVWIHSNQSNITLFGEKNNCKLNTAQPSCRLKLSSHLLL